MAERITSRTNPLMAHIRRRKTAPMELLTVLGLNRSAHPGRRKSPSAP